MMLHEPNISNPRRYIGYALSVFASGIIVMSGMMKVMGLQVILDSMKTLDLSEYTVIIGILEIVCVIIYWIPKTSNIGFFLLCSYCGGIIASELSMGENAIVGIVVAILFYIGTMLRKPSLSGLGI